MASNAKQFTLFDVFTSQIDRIWRPAEFQRMFEITGDDIVALNDEDLRALVGQRCDAEVRRRELSTAAVTWGGNETAKDGGLDVRVPQLA
jgi:hypothetical protein